MSSTVRVSKGDREALEALRKRIGAKTLTETIRYAIATAEAGDEKFTGNIEALEELLRASGRSSKGRAMVTEHIDEEIARALAEEPAEK